MILWDLEGKGDKNLKLGHNMWNEEEWLSEVLKDNLLSLRVIAKGQRTRDTSSKYFAFWKFH